MDNLDRSYWEDIEHWPSAEEDAVWTTRGGERIPVKNMATDHIKNTLRYFRGDLRFVLYGWQDVFEAELARRGKYDRRATVPTLR